MELQTEQRAGAGSYTCPMHPEVRRQGPGKCPKCGMDLVPEEKQEPGAGGREHGHLEMTRRMRAKWLWTNFTVMSLGLWLATSPFTFGYAGETALAWSDVLSGAGLLFFAGLALWPRWDFIGRWTACLIGVWLEFAPLVFWAKSPAAFALDTLIGALVIGLTVLVPMMPGMAHHMAMMKPGPEIPPGWTYNPSSWHQRAPMIGLALIGWFISRVLAAYQLGFIRTIWEPFFSQGTVNVLTSEVSKSWPVSDAGLGALAYTLEFLMGWMGAVTRWRTMPWMVAFFFILVVPLGLTHIILVILQPVAVGSWCTLCLAAAAVMLAMIPLTVDEVVAMGQFLKYSVKKGKPFWRTFWVGDTMEGGKEDDRTPAYGAPAGRMVKPMVWGVSAPWALAASALVGLWLMFAPAIFGTAGRAADSDHLVGALIVTTSVIVMAEVIRAGRFLNMLFGAWLMAAPWLLEGFSPSARWNGVLAGVALLLLSFPRGPVRERYAGWDRLIV